MAYKVEQDIINGVEEDEIDDAEDTKNDELESAPKVVKAVAQKDLPRDEKRRLQKADLLRKEKSYYI